MAGADAWVVRESAGWMEGGQPTSLETMEWHSWLGCYMGEGCGGWRMDEQGTVHPTSGVPIIHDNSYVTGNIRNFEMENKRSCLTLVAEFGRAEVGRKWKTHPTAISWSDLLSQLRQFSIHEGQVVLTVSTLQQEVSR